jgi:hypothetical protein
MAAPGFCFPVRGPLLPREHCPWPTSSQCIWHGHQLGMVGLALTTQCAWAPQSCLSDSGLLLLGEVPCSVASTLQAPHSLPDPWLPLSTCPCREGAELP